MGFLQLMVVHTLEEDDANNVSACLWRVLFLDLLQRWEVFLIMITTANHEYFDVQDGYIDWAEFKKSETQHVAA